jgi:hypothetical protein
MYKTISKLLKLITPTLKINNIHKINLRIQNYKFSIKLFFILSSFGFHISLLPQLGCLPLLQYHLDHLNNLATNQFH